MLARVPKPLLKQPLARVDRTLDRLLNQGVNCYTGKALAMTEKRVTVKVDDQTHHELKVKATQQGKSISDVIRDMIAAFIGKPKPKDGKQH